MSEAVSAARGSRSSSLARATTGGGSIATARGMAGPESKSSSGPPSKTIRPPAMTTILRALAASAMSCVTWMMPIRARKKPSMRRSISAREEGSSIAVASSKARQVPRIASAPATASLCCCPAERKCGGLWRSAARATAARASSTRLAISSRGRPRFSGRRPRLFDDGGRLSGRAAIGKRDSRRSG